MLGQKDGKPSTFRVSITRPGDALRVDLFCDGLDNAGLVAATTSWTELVGRLMLDMITQNNVDGVAYPVEPKSEFRRTEPK